MPTEAAPDTAGSAVRPGTTGAADTRRAEAPPAIALDGVGYAPAGGPPILHEVSWRVPAGQFHAVLGRSGCGKTTLLKLAAGLLRPDAGVVRLGGQGLRGPADDVGFVFQAPTLLDWLSAIDNVLLPLTLRGERTGGRPGRERALRLLEALGLGGLAERHPRALSGGQQARVAIARALVTAPRVLLLDEPFAALDALTREALQADLAALCARDGVSALLVTHDIAEAAFLADRVAVMEAGRIAEAVTVALPRPRPPDLRYDAAFNACCRTLRDALDRA